MFRLSTFVLVTLAMCMIAVSSIAGDNADTGVSVVWGHTAPNAHATAPIPVFVKITDIVDARQISVLASVTPSCYRLLPVPGQIDCIADSKAPPADSISDDTPPTWVTLFPSGTSGDVCLGFWLSSGGCSTSPPNLAVAELRIVDALGQIDTIVAGFVDGGGITRARYAGKHNVSVKPALRLSARPNPAAASLMLQYASGSTPAVLAIFDAGGRLIRKAHLGATGAGEGTYEWNLANSNGKRVRPGRYFARLIASSGTVVIPVAIIR